MAGQVDADEREALLATVESERRRLDAILRQMPALILVFDADGRIAEANDRYLDLLDLQAGEVVGRHYSDLPVSVEDEAGRPIPAADFPSARALRGEECSTELGIRHGHRLRWVQVSAAPIRGERGAIEGAVLSMRDHTAPHGVLAALQASEERNRALLDAIPDSMFLVDAEGILLEYKRAGDGRSTFPPSGMTTGCHVRELLPPAMSELMLGAVDATLATGEAQVREYVAPTADGPKHREARFVPCGPGRVLSISRDVDVRKRAEQERERLLASLQGERLLRDAILRQIPHSMLVLDREGRVIEINDGLLALLGRPKEAVIGQHVTDLGHEFFDLDGRPLPPEELPSLRALCGEEINRELRVRTSPDVEIWIQVSASPIRDEQGTIIGSVAASRNVTAEREAVAALRASEERNRALLAAIPDSIIVGSRDGVVLDNRPPNDGRPSPDWIRVGRNVREFATPERAEVVLQSVAAALDSGTLQISEYQIFTPEGAFYRESRFVACGPDQVLILTRDIDARKRAEHEREELLDRIENERRRLDAVLRQIPNSLLVLDQDGRVVELNDRFLATLGVPKEQVVGCYQGSLGRTYLDLDGSPLAHAELPSSRALRGEEVQRELRVIGHDGAHSWINTSAAPVRDELGAVVGAIVATRDVTVEREAVAALQASEATNRALVDAVPDSLYRLNRKGVIVSWKPARGLRQPAHLPADFHGLPIDAIVTPAVADVYHASIEEVLATGEPRVFEYVMPAPDMIGYREARIVRLNDDEVLALVRDIGDRKRAELGLQALNQELETRVQARTSELEAANSELEAFSYSVSHDLKAPLRGIDGYSQLLWEDYADRLDDDGRILLESVRQGAAQMHRLIDDLLAYSRLERRMVDEADVELAPILEGLLAERAEEIRARGVQVEVTAPATTARVDRDGFAQVIRNLLDNALRFTVESPEPRIEIGGEVHATRCTLWVRDNGIGFDMRYHDRIFEIFQRLHRQEEYPGTGIGLALVRKAMQRMQGRVWAESAPGAGATFYLELPRQPGVASRRDDA